MHCSTSFVFKILVFVTSDDPNTAIYVPGHLKWQTGLFQCRQQMLINMNDNWGRNKSSYASNAEYWSNIFLRIITFIYHFHCLDWMNGQIYLLWIQHGNNKMNQKALSYSWLLTSECEWHHKKAFMRCELKTYVLPSIQNMTD